MKMINNRIPINNREYQGIAGSNRRNRSVESIVSIESVESWSQQVNYFLSPPGRGAR